MFDFSVAWYYNKDKSSKEVLYRYENKQQIPFSLYLFVDDYALIFILVYHRKTRYSLRALQMLVL